MNFKTILFDFDGVLCFDRFYQSSLGVTHPDVFDWISKEVFEKDRNLVRQWMRGEISSEEINKEISEQTGMDLGTLLQAFHKSVENMKLDEDLLALIQELRKKGIKVGLVTDNMDVFSTITRIGYKLDDKFDAIVNSADHGFLKKELDGKLLNVVLEELGEPNISNSLMVDNQPEVVELYKKKGGSGFLYKELNEFQSWINSQ